jgi:hypothetical protein
VVDDLSPDKRNTARQLWAYDKENLSSGNRSPVFSRCGGQRSTEKKQRPLEKRDSLATVAKVAYLTVRNRGVIFRYFVSMEKTEYHDWGYYFVLRVYK